MFGLLKAIFSLPEPKKADLEELKKIHDEIRSFSGEHLNRAAVRINKKWGYIDETGEVVIPIKYDQAYDFIDNFAVVYLDEYPITRFGPKRKQGIIIDKWGAWFTVPDQNMEGNLIKTGEGEYKFYTYNNVFEEETWVNYKNGKFVNYTGYSYNNPRYPKEFEHRY